MMTDIKAFDEKWGKSGLQDADLAQREGLAVADVTEARAFLRQYLGFSMENKIKLWDQLQNAKSHAYVAPPPDPNAVKSVFGPTMTQKTIAMELDAEYWQKMEALLKRVLGK